MDASPQRLRLARAALVAAVMAASVLGCAANPSEPRASAGTLTDEANVGAYDAWEVFPATDADPSVVIAARGPDGASGALRFLPSNDGSLTIIAEAAGTSSQLDLDADGSVAGEAHAPAADAMLLELVDDLDARQDELFALAMPTGDGAAADDEGAAREALTLGFDLPCAFATVRAWIRWEAAPTCGLPQGPAPTNALRLFVVTPERRLLNSVSWTEAGRPTTGDVFALTYRELANDAEAEIPRSVMEAGPIELHFHYNTSYGTQVRHLQLPSRAWDGLRYEIVKFDDWCNDSPCGVGVCVTRLRDTCSGNCGGRRAEQSQCTDTL